MAQTAKITADRGQQPAAAGFTYQVVGGIRTLEQMLQVETLCGEKRYALMDASLGEPAGTLTDKLDLLRAVRTITAQHLAAEQKYLQKGHRDDPEDNLGVSLR